MNKIKPSSEVPLSMRDLYDKVNELVDAINKKEITPDKKDVQDKGSIGEIKPVQYSSTDYRLEIKFNDGWYVTDTLTKKV